MEFRAADGRLLFRELTSGGALKRDARRYEPLPGGGYRITLALEAPADERLWGMGQYQDGVGDLKGSTLELAHRNSQASVPFLLLYGPLHVVLWHGDGTGDPWGTELDPALARIPVDEVTAALDRLTLTV